MMLKQIQKPGELTANTTIRLLIAGFSIIMALMIILQIVVLRENTALADLTEKMQRHPLTVSNAVLRVNVDIVSLQLYMKDITGAQNSAELENAVRKVENTEVHIHKEFELVMERYLGNPKTVEKAYLRFVRSQPVHKAIIQMAREGNSELARELSRQHEVQYFQEIIRDMNELIDFANGKANEFASISRKAQAQSQRIILLVTPTAMFLAGLVAIFVILKVNKAERKLEENRQLLRKAQQMEALGRLTGGIAHDFNNILGIIMGNVEALQNTGLPADKSQRRVALALRGAERGRDLIEKLLRFSRSESVEEEETSVNGVVLDTKGLLGVTLKSGITIETNLYDDLWFVLVNKGELQDTVLNLCLNARDAIGQSGTIFIDTCNQTRSAEDIQQGDPIPAGNFVVLSIRDTGSGMSQNVLDHVTEPFFSTKKEGQGIGLGFSMVYGFVQRAEGHLEIDSELGEGTTIRIFLPRTSLSLAQKPLAGHETQTASHLIAKSEGETILVVDDEKVLVEVTTSYLEQLGYKTLTAHNSEQALAVLAKHPGVDVLLSDIIMPGDLDGRALAEAVRSIRPGIKIQLTSGYSERFKDLQPDRSDPIGQLMENLLKKPYSQAELAVAIRKTLDAPAQ